MWYNLYGFGDIMTFDDLKKILLSNEPILEIVNHEKELFGLIKPLEKCKGHNQNNPWHLYDVYEHILHVVENTEPILELRLAALFHDIGKPKVVKLGQDGFNHYYNHWTKSQEIFLSFAHEHKLPDNISQTVSNLILYHDKNLEECTENELSCILLNFNREELKLLYKLKRADAKSQNQELVLKYNLYNKYNEQEKFLLDNYLFKKECSSKIK